MPGHIESKLPVLFTKDRLPPRTAAVVKIVAPDTLEEVPGTRMKTSDLEVVLPIITRELEDRDPTLTDYLLVVWVSH